MTIPLQKPVMPPAVLDTVIPSVPGEVYLYRAHFTAARPLYFFMKCRANKARPLSPDLGDYLQELDAVFAFGAQPLLCSPTEAPALALLRSQLGADKLRALHATELRPLLLPPGSVERRFGARTVLGLVDVFHSAPSGCGVVPLTRGTTVAFRSATNKYGVLQVNDLRDMSCMVTASHVLL